MIFILISTSLCITNDQSTTDNGTGSAPDKNLDTLYLGKNYLLPDPPGSDKANKTELSALNKTIFGHNIRDRKYDKKLEPELHLWLNAHGRRDIKLKFEIVFQAVEDNIPLPGKTYKILFENHTTNGTTGPFNLRVPFIDYNGKPFDIKSGADNWCIVQLVIKRTDNVTDGELTIYTGAEDRISYIKLPYNQTLSAYNRDLEEKDKNATPGFEINAVLLTLVAVAIILFYHKCKGSNNKYRSSSNLGKQEK